MPTIYKRASKNRKSITYQVKCRFKGEKSFSKSFSKLRDAKQWAAEIQSSKNKRKAYTDPGAYKTVAEAIDFRIDAGVDRADAGSLYAEAADYPEYNDEERYSLAGRTCLKS
jgi:hypothetical protein